MASFVQATLPRAFRWLGGVLPTVWPVRRSRRGGRSARAAVADPTPGEALGNTNRQLQAILDNVADGVATIDERGIVHVFNPAAERMFGYAAAEVIGRNVSMLMPEPDRSNHDRYLETYMRDGRSAIIDVGPREVTARRKDGSTFAMELAIGLVGMGEERRFVGAMRDITDRKQAMIALRQSEQRYRAIIEDQTELVCRSLPDGTITFVNDAYCRYFEATAEALIGSDGLVRLPARDRRVAKAAIAVLRPKHPVATVEHRVATATGELRWLQWTIRGIWNSAGEVAEVQAVGRDMTERRRAHEAMRESETQLRQVIDLLPHIIYAKDLEGRHILVNQAAAESYGTTVEEMTGSLQSDYHHDAEELAQFMAADREVIESEKQKFIYEQVFHDRKGQRRFLRTHKVPFRTNKSAQPAVLGISMDVTELKAAEEQLRQAQKMEALGQLTGGVAHDFNNLLTVVLGNLQLIQRQTTGDPRLERLTDAAIRAVRRGGDLTRRLLAFARRQVLELRVLDLNAVVGDTSELLSRTLGERVTMKLVYGADLWKTKSDPAQLQNALLNLAINANHAMRDGGTLTIETANVEIDEKIARHGDELAPGGYVSLSVTDDGAGMPREVIERAFDPFFTTKETAEGSGLGLSMVYSFARQSGGHATICSEPGRGTTVTILLPRVEDEERAPADTVAPVAGKLRNETVLLVEDDAGIREVAGHLLRGWGYTVLSASDGPQALEFLSGPHEIDVLFSDVMLPKGMNGYLLAKEARRARPDLKVLFASGNAQFDPGRDGALEYAFDFLRKPYLAEELASALRTLLDNPETIE